MSVTDCACAVLGLATKMGAMSVTLPLSSYQCREGKWKSVRTCSTVAFVGCHYHAEVGYQRGKSVSYMLMN